MNVRPVILKPGQRLACCKCGQMTALFADVQGPAYAAFYCPLCLAEAVQKEELDKAKT